MKRQWTKVRLGDVCIKIGSGATPRGGKESYKGGETTLIRSQNIYNDGFHRDGLVFIDNNLAAELENVKLLPNDVLLNITGDSVARCCQVDPEILPARVNQHVAIIRPQPNALDAQYLRYVLVSHEYQSRLLALASAGATRPALTKTMIEELDITAPPLLEQKAIARILGTLDAKIELNRQMNATLEAMARALFQSWFVDFDPVRAKLDGRKPAGMDEATAALFPAHFDHIRIGSLPKGWQRKRWGDIATLEYGKSLRDYRRTSGRYRVFGTNGPIGFHDQYLCADAGIVIGRKGAYRGIHYSSEPFFVIDTAFFLKPKVHFDLKWAYYELLRFDINNMDSGSAIPSTSRDDFYGIPVIFPSTEIQSVFGDIVACWFSEILANEEQSRTLAILRDMLLPKFVSGEMNTTGQIPT